MSTEQNHLEIHGSPWFVNADFDTVTQQLGVGNYGLEFGCGYNPTRVHVLQQHLGLPSLPWIFTDDDSDLLYEIEIGIDGDKEWNRAGINPHPFYVCDHFSMPEELLDAGILLVRNPHISTLGGMFPRRELLHPGAHFVVILDYYGTSSEQVRQTSVYLKNLGYDPTFAQYIVDDEHKPFVFDYGIDDVYHYNSALIFHYTA